MKERCQWAGSDPLYIDYHDTEWGAPAHDDSRLFEMLVLEGAQAGLSWITILRKRENYRSAFDKFDVESVARYDQRKVQALLADTGIVRNRLKIASVIKNAQAFLRVQEEFGSFDSFIWKYVDGSPIQNQFKALAEIPAQTSLSQRISKDLKKRGFTFVGPTVCYSFMQSVGLVNDHLLHCFRYEQVQAEGRPMEK